MKKLIAIVVVLALVVVMLAACTTTPAESSAPASSEAPASSAAPASSEAASEAPASSAPAESASAAAEVKQPGSTGPETFAIIFKNTGNPYGEKLMEGFRVAVEDELGYTCIKKSPQNPTAEDQIAIINQLVSQKVSAIAISANDADALQPALTAAMDAGIKVLSYDSAVNPASRQVFINQADPDAIGRILVESAYDMTGGSGQFAILSATSQAANQNLWIEKMKKVLEDSKYANLELVKVAYGDDIRDKSVSETEGLLQAYPDLKCIVAPTTVGIAAAGKVLTDKGLQGKVALTGLGLPSEMADYITNGVCEYMYLWNPIDVGYLTGYTALSIVKGETTGKAGDKLTAGKLGEKSVTDDGAGGTQILLGDPFKFDKSNIDEWKSVY
jgi:rhamnose transport system substrate-binding protein